METTSALAALSALSQGHRLAIFRLLVRHAPTGLAAGAIGERLALPPATLSFHLKELATARLIVARQEGRFVWYRADFRSMGALVEYLTANCCELSPACGTACVPAALVKKVAAAQPQAPKRRSQ